MSFGMGSTGEGVKKLQQELNKHGYGLEVDGIFGNATQAAVRDYQTQNKLQVDGIAGQETLGSLYKPQTQTPVQSASGQTSTQTAPEKVPESSSYDPGTNEAYMKALAALEKVNGAAPVYTPTYEAQLEKLYEQIVGRGEFQYDLNADMLYDQYRTQYQRMGEQAMQDTMGQAAGLTGGYGSSYSQGVGQQAYNEYLAQLNGIVPELANQAYGRWQDEGTALQNQYAMLLDRADDEYGKYTDEYNRWLANLQMAKDEADTAYDRGYTDFINQQQMKYQAERDAEDDRRWQAEYELTLQQLAQNEAGSSGSSSGGGASYSYDTHGYDTEAIKAAQQRAGITVDGIWGPDTQAAYEAGYFGTGIKRTSSDALNTAIKNAGGSYEGQLLELQAMYNRGEITEKQLTDLAYAITNPHK